MSEYTTILPSAGRLMVSLRDIGYDLPGAVADLVDNSIDANAKHVAIDLVADGPDSWLRIVDDGLGMTPHQLDEAMRYGTDTSYSDDSLGHFGLGLKTASLSQARSLTVASRARGKKSIQARRWDLDEVIARNSWDLERVPESQLPTAISTSIDGEQGTAVLWQALDRVLPAKPTPGMTERVLRTAADELRAHLAMVFHRFLGGEAYEGRQKLEILLNGVAVEPWDPFARDEPETQVLPAQRIAFTDPTGSRVELQVQPFVLPGQQLFSSPEAHRAAAGPKRWNRHQGFYVYRRDRLIQSGGWNRIRTLDEHAKLARIAIDLPMGREELFSVDVAKMRITIPEDLRNSLRAMAAGVVAHAQGRYRDHLDASFPADERGPITAEAISMSRDWPVILEAVERVLGHDAELRDRLLVELANGDADQSETGIPNNASSVRAATS